jgi:hypothetical protein
MPLRLGDPPWLSELECRNERFKALPYIHSHVIRQLEEERVPRNSSPYRSFLNRDRKMKARTIIHRFPLGLPKNGGSYRLRKRFRTAFQAQQFRSLVVCLLDDGLRERALEKTHNLQRIKGANKIGPIVDLKR